MSSITYIFQLLILLQLTPYAYAQKVGVKSKVGFACLNAALNWTFDCPAVVLPFDCRCRSKEFLTTTMNCVAENAIDIKETYEGWNYVRDQCHYWGNMTMSLHEMELVYNQKVGSRVDPKDYDNASPQPVHIPKSLYENQLRGAKNTKYHYNVGNQFAWAIIGYWGLIMVGGILTNGIRVMNPNWYNIFGKGRVTCLRKFMTLPALMGTSHHSPIRLTRFLSLHMPTRGQTLIIFGFIALNVASVAAFNNVDGDAPLSFLSQHDRRLHYLANRTGIIAFGHIPLIVLFACRNNPLIILTGWPYDTFMTYHRWCARFMGIHAIIHAVAIYWSSLEEKVVMYKWHHVHNWRGGNLAAYMVVIMLIMALRRVRAHVYEIFKATHIVMFLIFIICLVVHCSDYGWLAWLYTSLAFYGIEYSGRIIRVIMSGGIQKAHFRLAGSEMYRITIPGDKRRWDIKPGSYIYIRILTKDLFWQSHPFSIFQSHTSEPDNSLDLCCKAQLGATRSILQKLIADPDKSFEKNVMIEGPYGNENYVCSYDSVFLFTGGVGFTAMYSYATRLLKEMRPGQCLYMIWVVKDCGHLTAFEEEVAFLVKNSGPTCKFRIFVTKPDQFELGTVVYANTVPASPNEPKNMEVAELNNAKNINTEDKPQASMEDLHPQVTLIANQDPEQSGSTHGSNCTEYERDSNDFACGDACRIIVEGNTVVNIDYGRPNISAEVSDFIRIASGSKAVCSCGPPMFVDMIRDGIVRSIVDSEARVDYFEDAFSW